MLGVHRRSVSIHVAAISLATAGLAAHAHAHIDLMSPEPREHGRNRGPNSNLKSGPCGQELNGRTDRVSVFEPGATIEVTWLETTNHRSYYRVAFDADGDDAFPTFLGNGVGTEGVDPRQLCPVDGQIILAYDMEDRSGGSHTLAVRLPDVECERCTLQVIQFMYDTGRPYYFQCADLALRRSPERASLPDGGAVDAGASDAGGGASSSAPPAADSDGGSGAAQATPRAAPGCSSRLGRERAPADDEDDDDSAPSSAAPQPSPAEETDVRATPAPARSEGSCSLAGRPSQGSKLVSGLSLLGVGAVTRARRRRRARLAR